MWPCFAIRILQLHATRKQLEPERMTQLTRRAMISLRKRWCAISGGSSLGGIEIFLFCKMHLR
jgi:hypothetical protein